MRDLTRALKNPGYDAWKLASPPEWEAPDDYDEDDLADDPDPDGDRLGEGR